MATIGILSPGDVLRDQQGERYRIEEWLGSGGFGMAYRATDIRESRQVAIKVLGPAAAARPAAAEEFAREAEAARQVVHKNVARTLAYVALDASGLGAPYMVIEYVSGGDLARRISEQNNTPLEQEVIVDWMLQLAEGLQAIHAHLLHRDFKPQNVLLDGDTLKISDFGMAKYLDESTRTVTFKGLGTIPYMAPEVWRGETATKATDIYALGITFYQLATSRLPFTAHDEPGWRYAHLFTPAPRPCSYRMDLDTRVDGMIFRMLHKPTSDRYQSTDDVIRLLKDIAAPSAAGATSLSDPVVRAARQTYDKQRVMLNQRSAEDEARREAWLPSITRCALADRLDGLVRKRNALLPESPIADSKNREQAHSFMDAFTGEMGRYAFFDRSLIYGFLDVNPEDLLMEDDPTPGYNPPGRRKRMVKREVLVDSASIAAIGYLKLDSRPAGRGLHLLLLRQPDSLYGAWKTCEIDESILSIRQTAGE